MLIVLSGVESIHKRLIARQIIAKMNKFVVDGYEMDLTMDDPFGIKDSDGNYISIEKFLHIDDTAKQYNTLNKMKEIEENVFQIQGMQNHLFNAYVAIEYEFGIFDVPDYTLEENKYPFTWDASKEAIIKRYKESDLKYFVITGSISKTFINELRVELGYSNVLSFNIIRNPSVCYYLHQKSEDFFNKPDDYNKIYDEEKLYDSLLNAVLLKEDKLTTTVKFEDMINTGKFFVNDKNIGLYPDYESKNEILTKFEYNNIVPKQNVNVVNIRKFNDKWKNINLYDLGSKSNDIKFNLFERLGYEPLTFEEIIAGKFKRL